MNVYWVPGHQDIRGNELAHKRAKEAAAEVSDKENIPIEMDKKEASELKRPVKEQVAQWATTTHLGASIMF